MAKNLNEEGGGQWPVGKFWKLFHGHLRVAVQKRDELLLQGNVGLNVCLKLLQIGVIDRVLLNGNWLNLRCFFLLGWVSRSLG